MTEDGKMHLIGEVNRLRDMVDALRADLAAARSFADFQKSELEKAMDGQVYLAKQHEAERDKLRAELAAERETIEKLRKLDAEAAKYCELPIIARTKFTGEPPYVGWKGLGLAMEEAFDERDTLRADLAAAKGER